MDNLAEHRIEIWSQETGERLDYSILLNRIRAGIEQICPKLDLESSAKELTERVNAACLNLLHTVLYIIARESGSENVHWEVPGDDNSLQHSFWCYSDNFGLVAVANTGWELFVNGLAISFCCENEYRNYMNVVINHAHKERFKEAIRSELAYRIGESYTGKRWHRQILDVQPDKDDVSSRSFVCLSYDDGVLSMVARGAQVFSVL